MCYAPRRPVPKRIPLRTKNVERQPFQLRSETPPRVSSRPPMDERITWAPKKPTSQRPMPKKFLFDPATVDKLLQAPRASRTPKTLDSLRTKAEKLLWAPKKPSVFKKRLF
uniref:Testicular haploid expressed protein n=1 Tax=Panagrolaimus sp. JU765 TaxID=591449 RepID=A0AC34RPP3_9BILA